MFKNFFKKKLEKKMSLVFDLEKSSNTNFDSAKKDLEKIRENLNNILSNLTRIDSDKTSDDLKFEKIVELTLPIFSEINIWFSENKFFLDMSSQENFQNYLIYYHNFSQKTLSSNSLVNLDNISKLIFELYQELSSLLDS